MQKKKKIRKTLATLGLAGILDISEKSPPSKKKCWPTILLTNKIQVVTIFISFSFIIIIFRCPPLWVNLVIQLDAGCNIYVVVH